MQRPGFSIHICPDSRLIRLQVEKALADHAAAAWERHAYWGDEALPPSFWQDLTVQGLFSTPKVLVVHNAQNIPADTWKRISSVLAAPLGDVWPFFCMQVDFDRSGAKVPAHIAKLQCMAFAQKKNWIWSSAGLDIKERAAFVQAEAKRLGLTLQAGALEAICARLPFDAAVICSEMEKIALAAPPDGAVGAAFADILEYEAEPNIFTLIRTLQQGKDVSEAWRQALASGGMVMPFLASLATEARQLWQLLTGEPVRLPPQIIPVKTALARTLGFAGVARLWHLALEADKGIKTGERDVDQALESLVAGLSLLFRNAPASGRYAGRR